MLGFCAHVLLTPYASKHPRKQLSQGHVPHKMTASGCEEAVGFHGNMSMWDGMQAEVALHSAGPLLSKVSLIAEEPTLMERVALMLHPSFALKGKHPPPHTTTPPPLAYHPSRPWGHNYSCLRQTRSWATFSFCSFMHTSIAFCLPRLVRWSHSHLGLGSDPLYWSQAISGTSGCVITVIVPLSIIVITYIVAIIVCRDKCMKRQTQGDAGEQVLKQGWPGRSMYFVRSGFVDLVMDGAVVDTIAAGDYFGEVALLALPPTHELLQVHIITVHAHSCSVFHGKFGRFCPQLRGLLLAVLQATTPDHLNNGPLCDAHISQLAGCRCFSNRAISCRHSA